MIELSVVIPVYNVEKYIHQCLDSVISSSFKDWECILVDDGSKDNSGSICDEYAKTDERFKVIHKPNGGLSSARNAGMDLAKGKWITFIDSDDFISPDRLEALMSCTNSNANIDIVFGGCTNYVDGKISDIEQHYFDHISTDMVEILNRFRGLMHTKLINADLLSNGEEGNPFRFDVKSKIEDMVFTLSILRKVNTVYFCSDNGYYYRRDNATSLTKMMSKWTYEQYLYDWKLCYSYYIQICKRCCLDPLSLEHRRSDMGASILSVINTLYYSEYSHSLRVKHIKEDFSEDEINYLHFCKKSNLVTWFGNVLLLKKKYIYFDICKSIYFNVLIFGSHIKKLLLYRNCQN